MDLKLLRREILSLGLCRNVWIEHSKTKYIITYFLEHTYKIFTVPKSENVDIYNTFIIHYNENVKA